MGSVTTHTMPRWGRAVGLVASILICALAAVWYTLVLINADPQFRKYLLTNALFLCSLSFVLLVPRFKKVRQSNGITATFKAWLQFWLKLGLLLPVALFVAERFLHFYIRELLLFILWPSYAMLMVPGISGTVLLVFLFLSTAVNAAIYTGFSTLVWYATTLFLTRNSKRSMALRIDRY